MRNTSDVTNKRNNKLLLEILLTSHTLNYD